MTTENGLAKLSETGISTRYNDDIFNDLTIQGGFLPRVNLYTGRSKIVQKELFKANHYGVVTGKDKLTDLGENINAVPLAYRPMALDMRDKKVIAYFDPKSPKFLECKAESLIKDSKCMAGVQFLLYIQGFGLATFYCASKSAKMLAPQVRKLMNSFITLGSHTVDTGEWVYRAPTVVLSNVEFEIPIADIIPKKEEFLNVGPIQVSDKDQEGDDVEVAPAPAGGTEARPR